MQEFTTEDAKELAEAAKELYKVFFKKLPYFKLLLLKVLFYDNGSYGLIITSSGLVAAKYTVHKSSEGFIVERGIKNSIGIRLEFEEAIARSLIKDKQQYVQKPYKLLKYICYFFKSLSIAGQSIFADRLEGSKVLLRVFEDSDMPLLLNWYNDYELNKLAGWSSGKISASKLRYNMSRSFGSDPMNLMIDDLNGRPIGTIQLYDFNTQDKSCRLGIRIGDRSYWSSGYGTDAVNTIAAYAFLELGINRIDLRVYEYNARAARCYEKCGFKHEGRSRKSAYIDGEYYDELLMGLLKSEFLSKQNNK